MLILLLSLFSFNLFSQTVPDITKIKQLLGDYPVMGSEASTKDFATLHHFQNTRTKADCVAATAEVKANLETFFGSMLSNSEFQTIKRKFPGIEANVILHAGMAKSIYKRPRPFVSDSNLKPCIKLEKTSAYPSGHATMAHLYARLLSNQFPERAEAFMKRGEEIALHRVVGGVHHPSDIDAGKKLGDAIAHEIINQDIIQE